MRAAARFEAIESLPRADAREDVRRHVLRVRRGRGDFRVAARGRHAEVRDRRIVEGVHDVVCDARVIRLLREDRLQDCRGLLLVGVALVVRIEVRRDRKRMQDLRLRIGRVTAHQRIHGDLVRELPRAVDALLRAVEERFDRGDVHAFALGPGTERSRLLDASPSRHRGPSRAAATGRGCPSRSWRGPNAPSRTRDRPRAPRRTLSGSRESRSCDRAAWRG